MTNLKWRTCAAAGLAVLALAASDVLAQNPYFQVRPGLTPQQYQYAQALAAAQRATMSPYVSGYGYNPLNLGGASASMYSANPFGGTTASMSSTPYGPTDPYGAGGYNPYYPVNPYYSDPYGGYLRGGADVIGAQGRFLINVQQANLVREQVRAERIANRRRVFEEYLYERERTPTLEQERERRNLQERDRSRNDPPLTEIWSGKALNDLLTDLRSLRAKGQLPAGRGPQIPLDEDALRHINITGKEGGNLGLLKNDGRLLWPVALSGNEGKEERERLNELVLAALEQAKFQNKVDAGTLKQITSDVEKLHKQLSRNVGDVPTAQYIEARRFLNHFDDALKVLGQPNVGNYVTRKWSAKGKTVADLVHNMLETGLQFAPAVAGDEAAYVALHRALAAFDVAMQNQVVAEPQR